MNRVFATGAIAFALTALAMPVSAQDADPAGHAGHSGHDMPEQAEPQTMQNMSHDMHQGMEHDMADVTGAEAALVAYREALVARDADAMTALFADASQIFENGKDEGSFANYMEHHLGPELDAITSFTFSEPTLSVVRAGHMAYGHETYNYRIELADGRVFDREGVATSVLQHDAQGWKIVQYHSSSRAPRN